MKTFIFCLKAFIHFLWVLITPWMKHTYYLSFTKEDDGEWYIDFPEWPFDHANLMMVAGADDLCEELSNCGNHVKVKVVTSNKEVETSDMTIHCHRVWAYLRYGGQYFLPYFNHELTLVKDIWLCQVTLFVLGWWPKYIYITKI